MKPRTEQPATRTRRAGPSRKRGANKTPVVSVWASALMVIVAMLACCAPTSWAGTQATSANITPSLSPDRLGAKAALTLSIQYSGGQFGVPVPVRKSVVRFPAGMTLQVPSLHSCSATHLRSRGSAGCPARSQLGSGNALVETHAGSETIAERVALHAFLGPPDNFEPTFEILAQGHTPLDRRVVFTGSVAAINDVPYGEELVMSIPPVPSLPLEPDASIVTFSLTVGSSGSRRSHTRDAVLVPSSCPAGGFPFAAEFTYADGSITDAQARIPCP